MENVQKYEIKKLAPNRDDFELILYLDQPLTEFANELGSFPKERKDIAALAREILRDGYPTLKVTAVKVILGGVAAFALPLTSPPPSAKAEEVDGGPAHVAQADSIYYHVLSGDTLWKISVKYGAPIDQIRKANQLTSEELQINQRLIIPKAFHTVAAGDYLTVLAKKYGTTVEGIKQANNIYYVGVKRVY